MTRYFVDKDGKYIGGFEGETGIDVSAYTEVNSAPEDARQVWDNDKKKWGAKPAPVENKDDKLFAALKLSNPTVFTDAKISEIKGA